MSRSDSHSAAPFVSLPAAIVCLLVGTALMTLGLQSVLERQFTATNVMSAELWVRTVSVLGGTIETLGADSQQAELPFANLFWIMLSAHVLCWAVGSWIIAMRSRMPISRSLAIWGVYGGLWWFLPGIWLLLWTMAFALGMSGLQGLLLSTPALSIALSLAGWLATLFSILGTTDSVTTLSVDGDDNQRVPAIVWFAMVLYVVVFTTMNWQLFRGLLVPHGDSAMYEEHLWNVTHGKGFRSYLDQGLFLGEHLQVIHLLLLPLHVLWPSHLMLELCESAALASGAIPIYWIARRHTQSRRAGVLLSVAYLLYFPLQFLDISIDLKTFRPISFGVPLMLFAIDRLERGRYRSMTVLFLLTLAAKEDFAIIMAPLGVWIALGQTKFRQSLLATSASSQDEPTGKPTVDQSEPGVSSASARWFGCAMAVCSTAYLLLAVKYVIPWFRRGVEVHYVGYFDRFGNSLNEVVWTMVSQPGRLLGELATVNTLLYGVLLLLPLGFVPLLSIGRLAVAGPLFALLCLNQLANSPVPEHHFHAPVVPIIFWAAAAGLSRFSGIRNRGNKGETGTSDEKVVSGDSTHTNWPMHFVWTSALSTGIFFGLSPLSLRFWDPGSAQNWTRLYVPGKRAEMFARVESQIHQESKVASTDHIHPRFTHHLRSYDYSKYPRAVNDNKPGAPPDTDYIVIDTQHYYSEIKSSEQIPELRDHPSEWELLPDVTEGYFIVLKRVK